MTADEKQRHAEMIEVIEAALEYIDAIPKDARDRFPPMPGFSRDWAESVLMRSHL